MVVPGRRSERIKQNVTNTVKKVKPDTKIDDEEESETEVQSKRIKQNVTDTVKKVKPDIKIVDEEESETKVQVTIKTEKKRTGAKNDVEVKKSQTDSCDEAEKKAVVKDEGEMDWPDETKNVSMKSTKRKSETEDDVGVKKLKTDPQGAFKTLLLSNLPRNTTIKAFNSFLNGKGIRCWASRTNFPRCKAFIDISSSDEAQALELDQVEWNNSTISVTKATTKSPSNIDSSLKTKKKSPRPSRTLLVKNLPYDATSQDLKSIFKNVEDVRLIEHKYNRKARDIAFVDFVDMKSVHEAVNKEGGYIFNGRELWLEYTKRRRKRQILHHQRSGHDRDGKNQDVTKPARPRTLFLKGETSDVSEEELKGYFKDAVFLHMSKNTPGKIKFSAGVTFDSEKRLERRSSKGGIKDIQIQRNVVTKGDEERNGAEACSD